MAKVTITFEDAGDGVVDGEAVTIVDSEFVFEPPIRADGTGLTKAQYLALVAKRAVSSAVTWEEHVSVSDMDLCDE